MLALSYVTSAMSDIGHPTYSVLTPYRFMGFKDTRQSLKFGLSYILPLSVGHTWQVTYTEGGEKTVPLEVIKRYFHWRLKVTRPLICLVNRTNRVRHTGDRE
jgi:hypothetical protein